MAAETGYWGKAKPYAAIIGLQFGYAGTYIISMMGMKRGMSNFVLVVYRHLVAAVVIAPFAFFLDRKTRPKMTTSTFLKILAMGFLEPVLDQNLYFLGMKKTSATYASAFVNLLPALTFILAAIFRLEKIKIKRAAGQAKVIGTVVTVTGAMVMTLYKGPIIDLVWTRASSPHNVTAADNRHWFIGTLMLIASACSWAAFFIVQSFTVRDYPAELSLTWLICAVGLAETGAVAVVMERRLAAWAIGWDSRLLAPIYTGVVCSGLAYYVQGMVTKTHGPVFVTAFAPLCMIITAALGTLILADELHLGSIIGATVIVIGLYSVVWGKNKDRSSSPTMNDDDCNKQGLPVINTAMNPENGSHGTINSQG